MTNNGPISVSAPGKSLTGALGTDITFNTRYPFAKLDSTNQNSFQIITVFFSTEPPSPSAGGSPVKTLIYSYPHGYSYVPSTWFLVSTDNFTSALASEGAWIYGQATGVGSSAKLEIEVDTTNVDIYINKNWPNNLVPAPNIIGTFVSIRAYVFVNDLSGTDVPSQA